jgi:UDP-N-acetylmuramate dehydrogenase
MKNEKMADRRPFFSFFIPYAKRCVLIKENYPLLPHNTFGIKATTRLFVAYDNEQELQSILSDEYLLSLPVFHIGGGSNLLFVSDYRGVILHSGIKNIETVREDDDRVYVRAGAGVVWDDLVRFAVERGWGGLENLSGIPGEVGAAAVQNIGAYGCEVKDVITELSACDILTGEKRTIHNAECRYGYRQSIFKTEWKDRFIITGVTFELSKRPRYNLEYGDLKRLLANDDICLTTIRQAIIDIRSAKLPDPKVWGNAGSFFMNPCVSIAHYESLKESFPDMPHYPANGDTVKIPAAWLIDRCGLKGMQEGNAAVYDGHPLVLINTGGATGMEVLRLAEKVMECVKRKFRIDLTPEVRYIR